MMFEGSMVALVTPFKDGKVDEEGLKALVDFHVEAGTAVIVPCGTTGESATLTHEEHDLVISLVVKHADKRVKVLAGAGSNATAEAIRLNKFCESVGADGTLHITPYYNKPPQQGLLEHFKAIAASSDVPIILYNVPGRTAVNMTAETTIELSKIKNIVGVKEASGDVNQIDEIIKGTADDFSVISGDDELTYELYCKGACGVISVTANVVPAKCAEQFKAIKSGDTKRAQEIHEELLALHKIMFVETSPIPVKAALAMMGRIEEEYRLPLVNMTQGNREKLKAVLTNMGLIS